MKRNDLLKLLRRTGCFLKREGANHSLWMSSINGNIEAIPRHNEISEMLAKKIIKNLTTKN